MSHAAEFSTMHCQPMHGEAALDAQGLAAGLAALPDWKLVQGAIERTFTFADYHETIAFVNALAWVVHREDHHPDLAVSYNRCTVRLNTHDVDGISINDLIVAAKADTLLAQ